MKDKQITRTPRSVDNVVKNKNTGGLCCLDPPCMFYNCNACKHMLVVKSCSGFTAVREPTSVVSRDFAVASVMVHGYRPFRTRLHIYAMNHGTTTGLSQNKLRCHVRCFEIFYEKQPLHYDISNPPDLYMFCRSTGSAQSRLHFIPPNLHLSFVRGQRQDLVQARCHSTYCCTKSSIRSVRVSRPLTYDHSGAVRCST